MGTIPPGADRHEADLHSSSPFSYSDGDIILRSADGADLRVHTALLSLASPFFHDMFSLRQTSKEVQTIEMTEEADVLVAILQLIYPIKEPPPYASRLVLDVYIAADKLQITKVEPIARHRLCTWLEEEIRNPLEAWAIAMQLDVPEAITPAKRRFISVDTTACLMELPDILKKITVEKYVALVHSKEAAIDEAWTSFTAEFNCQSLGDERLECVYCILFVHYYRSIIQRAEIFEPKAADQETLLDCHKTASRRTRNECSQRRINDRVVERGGFREELSIILKKYLMSK